MSADPVEHRLPQGGEVFGLDRVGRMVGEGSVELPEEDADIEGKALEDDRGDQTTHAVGGVGHDAQRLEGVDVDEGAHVVGVLVEQVPMLQRCEPRRVQWRRAVGRPSVEELLGRRLDLGQSRVPADRTGARQAELAARCTGRGCERR